MAISEKQMKILAFSYTTKYQSLICDGAVRSGKTSIMTIAFIDWAMREFNNTNFAICGKTVGSAIKNIIVPYMSTAYSRKYNVNFTRSDNKMTVQYGSRINTFYIYGGKDESSYMLIQGITLGGVLLDEVALMTRSFVEQALARCSINKSRFWFNCNPENPEHWFREEWILKVEQKKALHLHFAMTDNPSLSQEILERYENMYSGVFYERYVKGCWVVAEGLIYPDYKDAIVPTVDRKYTEYQISIDYGIQNPFAMGLYGLCGGVWYKVKEYHHSGRETHKQKTDGEYYEDLEKFAGDLPIRRIIIDPSASSFITLIRRKNVYVAVEAKNAVLDGIRNTASAMKQGKLKINDCCIESIKEADVYAWDEKATEDTPIKESDHHCDEMRYFVQTNKLVMPILKLF